MRPERAPKQTLFSSVEYGKGKEEKHTPVGENWGREEYRDTLNHWSRT